MRKGNSMLTMLPQAPQSSGKSSRTGRGRRSRFSRCGAAKPSGLSTCATKTLAGSGLPVILPSASMRMQRNPVEMVWSRRHPRKRLRLRPGRWREACRPMQPLRLGKLSNCPVKSAELRALATRGCAHWRETPASLSCTGGRLWRTHWRHPAGSSKSHARTRSLVCSRSARTFKYRVQEKSSRV